MGCCPSPESPVGSVLQISLSNPRATRPKSGLVGLQRFTYLSCPVIAVRKTPDGEMVATIRCKLRESFVGAKHGFGCVTIKYFGLILGE